MATKKPPTRPTTLNRLIGIDHPTREALLDLLHCEHLDDSDVRFFETDGAEGFVVYGSVACQAEGRRLIAITLGREIRPHENRKSAELVVVIVDGIAYAYGYGEGWRLIPAELRDPRFGMRFAIRCLDADQIQSLTRHLPGQRGRVEFTQITETAPVWRFGGTARRAEIVRRISGKSVTVPTTYGQTSGRKATVEGSAGLKIRLALEASHLVADIREIARVVASRALVPELEFADDIQPINDSDTEDILDLELGSMLGRASDFGEEIASVVPDSCMELYSDAVGFDYKIGLGSTLVTDDLALEHMLTRIAGLCPGRRVEALRKGRIIMYGDAAHDEVLGQERAAKWLEAGIRYGGRQYFLLDGRWYEFGDRYLAAVRRQVTEILERGSTVTLPPWYRGSTNPWDEKRYNKEAANAGFVNLDRCLVTARVHRMGIEMADLLSEANDLIHIKHAWKSAPLSHLFKQGVVAVMALDNEPDAVEGFAKAVRECGAGRELPVAFRPKKVIFGILLKDGVPLTADTLFTFAQIALLDTVDVLNDRGISVDVTSIEATDVSGEIDHSKAA
jgi:uncharacterized protein (TIGR04141 family)